jgi:DNA replication factor GINS
MGGEGANDDPGDGHASADAVETASGRDQSEHADGGDRAHEEPDGADVEADGAGATPTARATLRVTQDVGEIFGVDEREYELSAEDVVTLPEENADVLVSQGAAERLD